MSDNVHPYFWIRRNGDTFVPLIPVDELPSWVNIQGASPTQNWEVMCQGAPTKFLGDHVDHSGKHYAVDLVGAPAAAKAADDASTPKASVAGPVQKEPAGTRASEKAVTGMKEVKTNTNNITPTDTSVQDDSQDESQDDSPDKESSNAKWPGTIGTLGKKVYCTYWIRTGNCNYMQEGCKYRHEIPKDDDTRLQIGVRTYPTWPREDPVAAPRPPIGKKPSQEKKPPFQSTWRRSDAKGAQTGARGSANSKSRPQISDSKPNDSVAAGTSQKASAQLLSTVPPSSNQPAKDVNNANNNDQQQQPIAAVNPLQHFPSTTVQSQQSIPNVGMAHQNTTTPQSQHPLPGSWVNTNSKSRARPVQPSVNGSAAAQSPQTTTGYNPFQQRVDTYNYGQPFNANGPGNTNQPGFLQTLNASGAFQAQTPGGAPPYMPINFAQGPSNNSQANVPATAGSHGSVKSPPMQVLGARKNNAGVLSPSHHNATPQFTFDGNNDPSSVPGNAHPGNALSLLLAASASGEGMARNTPGSSQTQGLTPETNTSATFASNNGNTSVTDPAIISTTRAQPQTPVNAKGTNGSKKSNHNSVNGNGNVTASESGADDGASEVTVNSPPIMHKRMFVQPGQERYVSYPAETTHRSRKNGHRSGHKGKKNGHGEKNNGQNNGQAQGQAQGQAHGQPST